MEKVIYDILMLITATLAGFNASLWASRHEAWYSPKKFKKYLKEKLPDKINKKLKALLFNYAQSEEDLNTIHSFLTSPGTSQEFIKLCQSASQNLKAETNQFIQPITQKLTQINPEELLGDLFDIGIYIIGQQPGLRDEIILRSAFDIPEIKELIVTYREEEKSELQELKELIIDKQTKGDTLPLGPPWNVPFRTNPNFTGRDNEMRRLKEMLGHDEEVIINQVGQIDGMGGVGKTQLAVEYAHKHKDTYPGGVLWVRGAEDIVADYGMLSDHLGLGLPDNMPPEDKCAHVQRCLQNKAPMTLLILDNLDDRQNHESIRSYLPTSGNCQILITTRIRDLGDGDSLSLDILPIDKAITLLIKESVRDGEDREIAQDICLMLGNLPLAIEAAGKYFKHINKLIPFKEYYAKLIETGIIDHTNIKLHNFDHTASLKATLMVNQELMADGEIMKMLSAIICFEPDSINPDLLTLVCDMDKEKTDELISLLDNYSIVQIQEDNRLSIHRLMREALTEQLSPAVAVGEGLVPSRDGGRGQAPPLHNISYAVKEMQRAYVLQLQKWFDEHNDVTSLKTTTPEIPHILAAADLACNQNIWPTSYDLYIDLGKYYWYMGRHQHAIHWGQKSEAEVKAKAPNDLTKLSLSYNDIGTYWNSLGEYKKAIDYFEQALPLYKEILGKKHPFVATCLNNLGLAWYSLGEYNKAISYFEQALRIDKAAYGDNHPDVAIDLNNLGAAWNALGEYNKAIDYYEQALSIDKAAFGEKHPKVAIRLNNLGEAWRALGEYNKAIDYYEQALRIDKAAFGEKHPQVATGLNNLGLAWYSLGDSAQARAYYQQAYEIFVQFLGEDHPSTQTVKGNMAALGM